MGVIASTFQELSGDSISVDQEGVFEAERRFQCKTERVSDGPFSVLTFAGTPKPFSVYPGNKLLFVTTPAITRKAETSLWFDITVPYSSERDLDPTKRPAEIEWGAEAYKRIFLFKENGDLVLNTANDLYVPPLEGDDSRWVITVTKNMNRIPRRILGLDGAVNLDAFTVDGEKFPKFTVRVRGLRISTRKIENNIAFRVVSFGLHYQEEGWAHKVPSRGFRQLVEREKDGKKVKVLEEIVIEAQSPKEPLFLDKKGLYIPTPTRKNIVIQTIHTIKRRRFKGTLPLV